MTRRWWLAALGVALLALAAAWPGLANGFTYDDALVVADNPRVHALGGVWRAFLESYWPRKYGTDGYRPLIIVLWALQWAAGDGAPWLFHAVNVALYMSASVLVLWVAGMLLPLRWAAVAAALFAVHPVHVEAVAGIVGQTELWSANLMLLAMGVYLRARARGPLSWRAWTAITACFAAALLIKEHAIMLPALLVAAELLVVRDRIGPAARLAAMRPVLLLHALVVAAALWARTAVKQGDVSGFHAFAGFQALGTDPVNRLLTVMNLVPEWFRLLFWPARLSIEYVPQEVEIATGLSISQLPGALLFLGMLGIAAACVRRRPTIAFGIAFFLLAFLPTSNLIVGAGMLLAERTLFLPSAGAMLAVAAALSVAAERLDAGGAPAWTARLALPAVVVPFLALGIWRSMDRTRVWRTNDTLIAAEIRDHPDSYRINYLRGAWYMWNGQQRLGEPYVLRAIRLFPLDPQPAYFLAENYRAAGLCEPAIRMYRHAIDVDSAHARSYRGMAVCQGMRGEYAAASHTLALAVARWGLTPPLEGVRRWLAGEQAKASATAAHPASTRQPGL